MRKHLRTTLPLALAAMFHATFAGADHRSLSIWVFAHDELADISDEQLQQDYFANWLVEMRQIQDVPIEIHFRRQTPGLTDLSYSEMDGLNALSAWSDATAAWHRQQNQPGGMVRYLLLTRNPLDKEGTTLGLAHQTGTAAIASIHSYATAGHELGHTLSATHEASEVLFNGWFCETYMFPTRLSIRSNCYRYSDRNRENIATYLKRLRH